MTKYMAAGAFQDLTADKASIPNSATWLGGLAASGRYGGKLYGVPYYAGSRVVTYRSDLFKKAGLKVPTSLAAVHGGRQEARIGEQRQGLLAGLHRGNRLVLRDELRLRLRRLDRDAGQRQVEGHARLAEGRWPASPRTRRSTRPPRGPARRPTRRIRTRTTSTPRARRPRWSGRAGSAAASATSTRARRSSS